MPGLSGYARRRNLSHTACGPKLDAPGPVRGKGEPVSNGNATDSDGNNPLNNVRNVLGFLLAGFGAILSFLGVRSSEVTTVLRNDSLQASLIALILLFGVLAAVWAVATDSKRKLSVLSVAAIGGVLAGVAALVVFAIPITAALLPSGTATRQYFTISGAISLAIACILVLLGIATLVHYGPFWVDQATVLPYEANNGRRRWQRWAESASKLPVHLVDVLILASVVLIAIAAYGAMRLETKSQLSFSSQVGASFTVDGSLATARIDIAATKIPQSDWVFVDVYAMPAETKLTHACALLYKRFTIPSTSAPCMSDPCLYFSRSRYQHLAKCAILSNGSIVPNATGNVDEILSVPFLATEYQDVDIRAEVCSLNEGCAGSPIGQNSRLDWVIPNSSGKPG
jgi:hypothetical protein